MLLYVSGDIFRSAAQTIVNPVNCVGVMGRGLAREFRRRFLEMHDDYVVRCRAGEVRIGQPYLFRSAAPPHVLNFPTKVHWRDRSRLEDVEAGLEYLLINHAVMGIESLAVPALGCGLGGLNWNVVGPVLWQRLSLLPIPVELYAPV